MAFLLSTIRHVDRLSNLVGQRPNVLDRLAGASHQCAPDDDAVGQLSYGLGLFSRPNSKANGQWFVGHSAHPGHKTGQAWRQPIAGASDASQRNQVDESLRLFGYQRDSLWRAGRGQQVHQGQATVLAGGFQFACLFGGQIGHDETVHASGRAVGHEALEAI